MSLQTRDLRCVDCGWVAWNSASEYGHYPDCSQCGGEMCVTWEGGHAPATDVWGSPQFSDATGEWHTSQREKAKKMADVGFYEAGDPVGGARPDHTLKRKAFSFTGQPSRTSTAERT